MTIAESNSVVPANISRIIRDKGFSQKAIAEKACLTPQQLTDILRGRKLIRPADIMALASAMQIDAGDLFRNPYDGNRQEIDAVYRRIGERRAAKASVFTPIGTDTSSLIPD